MINRFDENFSRLKHVMKIQQEFFIKTDISQHANIPKIESIKCNLCPRNCNTIWLTFLCQNYLKKNF